MLVCVCVYNGCVHIHVHVYTHAPSKMCLCRGGDRNRERERERAYIYETTTSFQILRQAEQHLEEVTKERSLYKSAIDTSKESIRQFFTSDGVFSPPQPACKSQPCPRPIKAHYSFDMAQQVFYPYDPQQAGPMYFLTPRKCAIFGVCCKAIPRQVNYPTDESVDTGKGANAIISMLHHFFEVQGLGEQDIHLHADNWGSE